MSIARLPSTSTSTWRPSLSRTSRCTIAPMKVVAHVPPEEFADVPTPFPREYVLLAWRRAALAEARRGLANFLPKPSGDDAERARILCEDAPYPVRYVPDAVIEEVVEALRALEQDVQHELQRFVMVRTDEPRGAKRRPEPAAVTIPKAKKPARDSKRRSRQRRATTRASSNAARAKTLARDVADPAPAGPSVSR
jgi:hypothetical protein